MMVSHKIVLILTLCVSLAGCSIRNIAIKSVTDGLSSGGNIFATDDDPELVRDAIPFGLKMYESLLEKTPRHKGLLLAAARGFTQYSYAFVQFEADLIEDGDLDMASILRKRAQHLYMRGRDYAIRGLEVDHPDFMTVLQVDAESALKPMTSKDVPFLYWIGISWSAAIVVSKNNLDLLSELYIVEDIMNHALTLDESFNNGALHEFFIAFDGGRSEAMGGSIKRARQHFDRVVELTEGKKSSPYVSLAEKVSVKEQDVKEFKAITVVVPLIIPMGEVFAINPLHLGIIFLTNLELGYLTPPVGINLFLSSYRFDSSLIQVYRDTIPFFLLLLVVVLLITYVPFLTIGFTTK